MIRLHTATSATGVKNYFSTADYYSQGQETVGHFRGKLAEEMGITGPVKKDAFDKLCDNVNPATGVKLTQRTKEGRRVGDDIIFSLPKDVGAAIMLAQPRERDELLAMVGRRVDDVMAMIEAGVMTRVRIDGKDEDRLTGNLCYAGFLHTTARPVDGHPPDPHPHWHQFAFNATRDPVEGRIKAVQMGEIFRDRPYFEAVFYSLVARDFAERGLAIERREGGKWGLSGLQSLGLRFSKRTGEIEDEARRLNITNASLKSELGAKTRARKQKELTPDQLRSAWDEQLTDDERDALARVVGKQARPARSVTAKEAVAFAIAHCSEQLSVVPERELIRVALLHGLGSVSLEQVQDELPRQGVLTDVIDGRTMATTAALQAEENRIIAVAANGRGAIDPVGVVAALDRALPGGKRLNDEQWEAACGLLRSENRVNLVEGPAGAGKSFLLQKYDEGLRRAGKKALYLGTTTDAVGVLEKDGFKAFTVARFLLDERMQHAAAGSRVVVDESSLLGHKDACKLFNLAEKLDLKLVLVGDGMQHGSVPRGSLLRVLKDFACIRPYRLTEIMRQEDLDYRAAARLLSQGQTLDGFDALDRKEWVKEITSEVERVEAIAEEYVQAVVNKKSVLVVSPTHAEGESITQAIRHRLLEAGRLGTDEREFSRLVATNASEAERGETSSYRPGDVLVFHQNAKGYKKGDRMTVSDPAEVPVAEAAKFSVFRTEAIRLAEGDRIRLTGTVTATDETKLRNGSVATVAGFTKRGDIRLEDGRVIKADAGFIRHGYVETSFGSQGKTVQRVILGMSAASLPATNQEQLYVSASRGKERLSLYTDDKDAVRRAIQRSSQKLAALDIQPRPTPPTTSSPWQRMQEQAAKKRKRAYFARLQAASEGNKPITQPVPQVAAAQSDRVERSRRSRGR